MSTPGAGPVRVGGAIATPELIHRAEPVYPASAVAARVQGTVVVEATVDERGHVTDTRVLRSIAAVMVSPGKAGGFSCEPLKAA